MKVRVYRTGWSRFDCWCVCVRMEILHVVWRILVLLKPLRRMMITRLAQTRNFGVFAN